jgi:transposase-like protein
MAIVPVGSIPLQVPEPFSPEFELQLVHQLHNLIPPIIGRFLDESLDIEVNRVLARKRYVRRRKSKRKESGVYCSKCRSHQRQNFRRNGHYVRGLNTSWGPVSVQVPQLKCQCGGNVKMSFRTVPARQRFWKDLEVEIQAQSADGLSYRQIKVGLDQRLRGSVGLRKLNECVLQQAAQPGFWKKWLAGEAPPVVRVDGIWVTVMFSTGEQRTDQLGRQRTVKSARKIPILAAQGVWPHSGRTQLLGWMPADGEDTLSWQKFLENMNEAGIIPEHGLRLLVADGGSGFRAAYENVYWTTPLQRCVFHKLRNVARAIRVPAGLDRKASREYSTQFLRTVARIWQAEDESDACLIYQEICQNWQAHQPKAIETLKRDFEDTLAFYAVQQQAALKGETWPAYLLRTTSPLERMFREFRQRYRRAILFHSVQGLLAVTTQLAKRFS